MRPLGCIYLLNPANGQDPRAPNVLKTIFVFFINYIIPNFKSLGGSTLNNQALGKNNAKVLLAFEVIIDYYTTLCTNNQILSENWFLVSSGINNQQNMTKSKGVLFQTARK